MQADIVSLGEYNSLEYLCTVMKSSPRILLVVFRPPKYSPNFIEFSEMLSITSTDFNSFIITGDFNIHIHIDSPNDNTSIELITLFDMFDLVQHVMGPTHIRMMSYTGFCYQ